MKITNVWRKNPEKVTRRAALLMGECCTVTCMTCLHEVVHPDLCRRAPEASLISDVIFLAAVCSTAHPWDVWGWGVQTWLVYGLQGVSKADGED